MLFTSLSFLVFLLIVVLVLAVTHSLRLRLFLLVLASWVFYGWWDVRFLPLLWAFTLVGWALGRFLDAQQDQKRRKLVLWLGVGGSLLTLGFFKYANFFAGILFGFLGKPVPHANIILPIGISFMTFEIISYFVDVYNRKIPACRDLADFAMFSAFFPRVISGPIIRAADFFPQLAAAPAFRRVDVTEGLQLFLIGMFQKTVLADNLGPFVDRIYLDPLLYTSGTLWFAVLAYSGQIFCDFAGYSLMAIGLARLFGFSLPPNFDFPYLARSLGEFWRRWHMSLSFWLRDYLYIPLGGSKLGRILTWRNLMTTMLLAGLWHGAGWNFVLWGALHGAGLVVAHAFGSRDDFAGALPASLRYAGMLRWLAMFLFVSLAWVVFRSPDMETLTSYAQGLFYGGTVSWFPPQSIAAIILLVAWHIMQLYRYGRLKILPAADPFGWRALTSIIVMIWAIVIFAPANISPFIYFQF